MPRQSLDERGHIRPFGLLFLVLSLLGSAIIVSGLLGLGVHRDVDPLQLGFAVVILMYGPPLLVFANATTARVSRFAWTTALWSVALYFVGMVYFPTEGADAVINGVATLTHGGYVVDKPLSQSDASEAVIAVAPAQFSPVGPELGATQIALPFEGKGHRMSIPVVLGHDGAEREVEMMIDTGATYTTLPRHLLEDIGVVVSETEAPTVTLQTASGSREAIMVVLDKVWLGDQTVEGVTIAVCDACEGRTTVGLLGLNVTRGFNLTIDSDLRMVIFDKRTQHDRKLDADPFVDIDSEFIRYPSGRTEVEVSLISNAPRALTRSSVEIGCGDEVWQIRFGVVPAYDERTKTKVLPTHEACEHYTVGLGPIDW